MVTDFFVLKQQLRFIGWQLEQGQLDFTQIQDLQRACIPLLVEGKHLAILVLAATLLGTADAADVGTTWVLHVVPMPPKFYILYECVLKRLNLYICPLT